MGNGKIPSILRLGLALWDVILIVFSYIAAFWLRFGFDPPAVNYDPFLKMLPLIIVFAIILFNVYGLYYVERKRLVDILSSLVLSIALLGIFTMAGTFFLRAFAFPRSIYLLGALIQIILLAVWRWAFWLVCRAFHGKKTILIAGDKEEAEQVIQKFSGNTKEWFKVVAIRSRFGEHLSEQLRGIDMVILCPGLDETTRSKLIAECVSQNKGLLVIPELYDILLVKAKSFRVDDLPLFELEPISLSPGQLIMKRALDLVMATVALALTLPIMIVVAFLIKMTSPGPIFYTQERMGLNGKKFIVYKFRTMIDNAEKLTGPVMAKEDDPRITRIGKYLRASRIDELPQFINVLKGEMSVVGPRPERPVFVNEFTAADPSFEYRMKVKPGITGLAQVLGKYSTEPENKLRYDLLYIRNYSLLLDLKIILQTIKTVLTREQASGIKKHRNGYSKSNTPNQFTVQVGKQNSTSA
jgi:exopolysaccharide biosynthesis polyprenyl glycosylphosphotransferase